MEAVASSSLGTQVAREGGHRLGKHLSQGKEPGTGDLAIAALDPTQVVSQVTGCPEFGKEAPGLCGDCLFLGMRPLPSLRTRFTKRRELWVGLATREGRGYPGSSHISQEHILALVYNVVRYINQ